VNLGVAMLVRVLLVVAVGFDRPLIY